MKPLSRNRFLHFMTYVFLTAIAAFTALPLIYTVNTAFKPMSELFLFPPRFFVRNPTTLNMENLFSTIDSQTVPFTRFVANSVVTSFLTVLLTVVVCSMGAYAVAKLKPRGSGAVSTIIIAALMFSPHVTMIPTYMVVDSLKLVDTQWALVITRVAVAYNFFLMQQFIRQIPNELIESARMDGANEMRLFWRIVMPNLKPAWATLVVLTFISSWNDFFTPLIYLSSQQKKTLPVVLQSLGATLASSGMVAAAAFLMILPPIAIYIFMQRKVIETMVHSGIKG